MIDLVETPTNGSATNGAARRDAWLADRRKVIGASDIAALIQLNRYMTAYDVWASKLYGIDSAENEAMKWGKRLEDDIIDATEEYLGIGIRPNDRLFTHPECDYFGATPDGFAADGAVVEAKYTAKPVDAPQRQHEAQVQWQMYVCGAPRGYLAYLAPNHQFHVFLIERDDEYIASLATVGHDFWQKHILTGEAPAAHTPEDVMKMHPRHTEGKVVEGDEATAELLETLANAKAQAAYWESIAKEAEAQIKVKIADGEALAIDGTVRATWKTAADSLTFDAKRFAAEHPDLHKQYMAPRPGSRRFLLK